MLTDTMLTFVVQCNGLASIIENNPYYATYIDYEEYRNLDAGPNHVTINANISAIDGVDWTKVDSYVNTYELDASDFNVLVLNSPDYCILHWITVLLKNRKFDLESPLSREAYRYLCDNYSIDFSNVDMVIGYRADDSYFSYARDFIDGIISVSQLSSAMRLDELGEQVFIRSKRAFAGLRYLGNEFVRADEWYGRKADRDTKARNAYRNLNKQAYISGDLYMVRIIDEEVKADDPRLQ